MHAVDENQPDPIVIYDEGKEVFRIARNGDFYQNGRLIEGDDNLRKAVTAFIEKFTGEMVR